MYWKKCHSRYNRIWGSPSRSFSQRTFVWWQSWLQSRSSNLRNHRPSPEETKGVGAICKINYLLDRLRCRDHLQSIFQTRNVLLETERLERSGPCWLLKLRWIGTQRVQMKTSLVGSLGLLCQYKRLLFCLGCSGRPRTKYFFPRRTLFQLFCLHHPKAGKAAVLGRLSLSMCVCLENWPFLFRRLLRPSDTRVAGRRTLQKRKS